MWVCVRVCTQCKWKLSMNSACLHFFSHSTMVASSSSSLSSLFIQLYESKYCRKMHEMKDKMQKKEEFKIKYNYGKKKLSEFLANIWDSHWPLHNSYELQWNNKNDGNANCKRDTNAIQTEWECCTYLAQIHLVCEMHTATKLGIFRFIHIISFL